MLNLIRFRCYYCRRLHETPAGSAGRRGRCLCGRHLIVPSGSWTDETAEQDGIVTARPWVEAPGGSGASGEPTVELDSPAPATPAGAFRAAPPDGGRPPERRRGSQLRRAARLGWGCILVLTSFLPLGAWAVHVFLPSQLEALPGAPSYWGLPSALWSTVLLTLFLGLAIEGVVCLARHE